VPPTAIAAWSTVPDDDALTYGLLAQIGAVLMIVPLLALGGSAARLVAARRNRRLSLLRIIGGSSAEVVGLTAAEAGVLGGAGALLRASPRTCPRASDRPLAPVGSGAGGVESRHLIVAQGGVERGQRRVVLRQGPGPGQRQDRRR
jgi:hypothetical protein